MSNGYNKLIESHKASQKNLKDKMKFVLLALTDTQAMYT